MHLFSVVHTPACLPHTPSCSCTYIHTKINASVALYHHNCTLKSLMFMSFVVSFPESNSGHPQRNTDGNILDHHLLPHHLCYRWYCICMYEYASLDLVCVLVLCTVATPCVQSSSTVFTVMYSS